jgi:hypothetical protein
MLYTKKKFICRGVKHHGNIFRGVSDPAEIHSEGSDIPQKFVYIL